MVDRLKQPLLSNNSTLNETADDVWAKQHKSTIFNSVSFIAMQPGEQRCMADNAEDNVLYARASSMVLEQGKGSLLLRAPCIVLAVFIGLWPDSYKLLQWAMITTGVLMNTYIMIGNVSVYSICTVIPVHVANALNPWLCYSVTGYNRTMTTSSQNIIHSVLLVRAMFSVAMLSGYVFMVYCISIALPSRKHAMSLGTATSLLSRTHWLKIDLEILLSLVMWLVYVFSHSHYDKAFFPEDNFLLWLKLEDLSFWFYIGTPCWIFAIIIFALESLVDACFDEIQDVRGSIDDAIKVYSTLCQHIFSTVHVLRYWFVTHWFIYGVIVVVEVAMGIKSIDMFPKQDDQVMFWIFSLAAFFFVAYSFLYPTMQAAALTNHCEQFLERLNGICADDWAPGHPFRKRRTMNDFLAFANQVQCGFRIGRVTFNNGLACVSVFFGIFGFILKIL